MQEKINTNILIGILICLILIALKPFPQNNEENTSNPSFVSESVVQLAENRIAIVETELNSGLRGNIIVLEFNEDRKTFEPIGRYNYLDFFTNPEKYNF
ncbi:hypothetical protein AWU65_24285 [Paenibacillus glucanolyticus]|uniref:Uncharacterized protein n=1 Tax=Paenibacillus glucanolyticus TaxID=59843 RepID=A0A163M883_9BACL|nr:hypothetical protein [Paenibacillus glucanolyticus]KZS48830.1 hypothetical protein AWU65_24285 [Paenibacillus glucanolyticus]